ncbi:site-specific integrase [Pseudomonas putida]|uniref:site-specific integrase n=1 Tax=Pseudomonas putida TaxID=303 RepID=UPI000A6708E1|nr:site-specific integrase [Pseudomonas putida]
MYTAQNTIRYIRNMFIWAEDKGYPLDIESIQQTYLNWTDSLVHRHQIVKDITPISAYTIGIGAGNVLDAVLNRETPLFSMCRLRLPKQRKTAQGVNAEKQNLADTFTFGHLLQDICDSLSAEIVLQAPLPIRIPLRCGEELIEWAAYPNPACAERHLEAYKLGLATPNQERALKHFRAWEADGTLRTRYALANRRIEAELLMFIGQTGMNFTQAHKLKLRHFTYSSHLDGYQVRDRKARRQGEVLFEIFKEYKPHFERYLEWRRLLLPESDSVFPFIRKGGRDFQRHPQFHLRATCKKIGLRFVPPQRLRNTRVNWLLRRTGDVDLTASMAQHHKETLLTIYERPSQQRAMGEIIRFWSQHDPTLTRTTPAGPGQCDGISVQLVSAPKNAPTPDCIRPSGCMWCEHHRDIDTMDYLWSLACFRHLKIIEVSRWIPPQHQKETHPAQQVINRISEKLRWFGESNKKRKTWLEEALARVEEGNYHPDWERRILAMEGAS